MNFIKINDNMVATFVRKPKHSSKAFRITFRQLNCNCKYHHWFCYIINVSLDLPSICNRIKCYRKTLVNFLEKYKKYNESLVRDTDNEHDFIYSLEGYLYEINDIDKYCKVFKLISAAQYKDMYNSKLCNIDSFYIGSYCGVVYELDRIRNQPEYKRNLLYFEKNIKDMNENLSKYWSIYISILNEQSTIQSIILDIESDYSKSNYNKNKISMFKCILLNYFNNSIDNSIVNVYNLVKKLLDITKKYNKKCKNYIKVMKDYDNFSRLMLL